MDTANRKRVLLIDADCFKYIFSWHHRDKEDAEDLCKDIRIRVDELLTLAGTRHYIGIFGSDCPWRTENYKYKPYKGNRGDKPEFVQKWAATIEDYCMNTLGFMKMPDWEADDVLARLMRGNAKGYSAGCEFVLCSPDKDLNQIPGMHLVWKRDFVDKIEGGLTMISEEAASQTFWMQMLTGDGTDNVAGVPGLGEKKALAILKDEHGAWLDPLEMELAVAGAYNKYFAEHYGPIIFAETKKALYMGPDEMREALLIVDPLSYIRELEDQTEARMEDMFNDLANL